MLFVVGGGAPRKELGGAAVSVSSLLSLLCTPDEACEGCTAECDGCAGCEACEGCAAECDECDG